jgi:hypothetical protein
VPWLAAAWVALLAVAVPAYGARADAIAGRVFTVATLHGAALGWVQPVAVSGDGTLWTLADEGRLFRQRPGEWRPTRVYTGHAYTDLAVARDGGLLLTEAASVWHLARGGTLARVAGTADGPDAEGWQAIRVPICSVGAVAALPDGGFVFTDRDGRAVRRVAPDGVILTLYAGTPADRAYGCPDDAAPTPVRVTDLAGERGGSVLLVVVAASQSSIVRVTATGRQTVLTTLRGLESVAATADGSVLVTRAQGIHRLAGGARRLETVLPGSTLAPVGPAVNPDPFAADGAPATRAFGLEFLSVASAPDGGVLAAGRDAGPWPGFGGESDRGAIVYVAPPRPRRLAAALLPLSGRATAAGYAASYRTTRPGHARMTILDGRGRTVTAVDARARAGLNHVEVRRALRPATYTVRLTVRRGEQVVRHAVRLFLGGTVPADYARTLLVPDTVDLGGGCSNCDPDERPVRFEGCRRVGAQRVDCRSSYESDDGRSCQIASAQLHPPGTLFIREYECPAGAGIPLPPPLGTLRSVLPEQFNPGASG